MAEISERQVVDFFCLTNDCSWLEYELEEPEESEETVVLRRSLSKGLWRDPYPLPDGRFLVVNDTDICLMKANGQTTSLYRIPEQDRKVGMKLHEPRPLRKSPRERIIPPRVNLKKATGRVMVVVFTVA